MTYVPKYRDAEGKVYTEEEAIEVIPKNTCYCYTLVGGKNGRPDFIICPFWDKNPHKTEQNCGYCHFTGDCDWSSGIGLLWDHCKTCGINEELFDDIEDEEVEEKE